MNKNGTVRCRNNKTGEERDVPADKLTFRPSAYGILIRDGSVLLNPIWDKWDFPGGAVELGETLEQALAREYYEETGLTVTVDRLLGLREGFFISHRDEGVYFHSIFFFYHCVDPRGNLSADNFVDYEKLYLGSPQWVPLERAPSLRFHHTTNALELIERARL